MSSSTRSTAGRPASRGARPGGPRRARARPPRDLEPGHPRQVCRCASAMSGSSSTTQDADHGGASAAAPPPNRRARTEDRRSPGGEPSRRAAGRPGRPAPGRAPRRPSAPPSLVGPAARRACSTRLVAGPARCRRRRSAGARVVLLDRCTSTRRVVARRTASKALSTRLPTTVTRSRARADARSGRRRASVVGDGQLDAALGGLAPTCRAAAPPGPARSTAPTTRSASRWATSSSVGGELDRLVAAAHLDSDTTVCSRLAASWVCERSDSVRPADESSSPVTRPAARCGRAG